MNLDVDINSDLYPLEINDRFTFALASTLALDGSTDSGAPSDRSHRGRHARRIHAPADFPWPAAPRASDAGVRGARVLGGCRPPPPPPPPRLRLAPLGVEVSALSSRLSPYPVGRRHL